MYNVAYNNVAHQRISPYLTGTRNTCLSLPNDAFTIYIPFGKCLSDTLYTPLPNFCLFIRFPFKV